MSTKSVSEILKERVLMTIKQENELPWAKPWNIRYAMNYWTGHQYTGVNRWIVPAGEYMSSKQLQAYNKKMGTDYKFVKGIKWEPVLFVTEKLYNVKKDELTPEEINLIMSNGFANKGGRKYIYSKEDNCIKVVVVVRKYYKVANIEYFKDENGKSPESKIEGTNPEIEFVCEEPEKVIESYLRREGIKLVHLNEDKSCYSAPLDHVRVPERKFFKNNSEYYSTVFHELIHSTGRKERLSRVGVVELEKYRDDKRVRAEEELIAEMGACLLCAETGLFDITHCAKESEFENSMAYVQYWSKFIQRPDVDIVSIASKAQKACDYVLQGIMEENEDTDSVKIG